MQPHPVLLFPDPRLRRPAVPVDLFDAALAALVDDIVATMRATSAIGLTAPHIGVGQRVMVLRSRSEEAPRSYVNPEIVWASSEEASHEEGSVSMPGVREAIVRPAKVQVAFRDVAGASHEVVAEDFAAAVFQHEIDQLDGVFWIDRLSRLKRERAVKRYDKARRLSAARA